MCLVEFVDRGSAVRLACSHQLCRGCIEKLERRAESSSGGPALCPLCRCELTAPSAHGRPMQIEPSYGVQPKANNRARQRRVARQQAQGQAATSCDAPAASPPTPMPHVASTPRSSEALRDGSAAAETAVAPPKVAAPPQAAISPDLEPLLAVVPDAPPAYLAHLLELAGGDVGFAITMHFDGGGVVPDEWRAALEAPRPPVEEKEEVAVVAVRRATDDDAQLRWRGAARATTLRRPATVQGAMGKWEVEHPSWLLPELPPAQQWAPTSGGGGGGGGGGSGGGGGGGSCGGGAAARGARAAPVLVWVRAGDLRLRDNPALVAAAASGRPVVPVYIQPSKAEQRGWAVQVLPSDHARPHARTHARTPARTHARTHSPAVQGAAAYWLHHSLLGLQHALRDRLGTALVLRAAEDDG